jgi:hypothetical protein
MRATAPRARRRPRMTGLDTFSNASAQGYQHLSESRDLLQRHGRAVMSVALPAPNGTKIRTRRIGQASGAEDCADTGRTVAMIPSNTIRQEAIRHVADPKADAAVQVAIVRRSIANTFNYDCVEQPVRTLTISTVFVTSVGRRWPSRLGFSLSESTGSGRTLARIHGTHPCLLWVKNGSGRAGTPCPFYPRYCCKSRKSDNTKNLAKVDFWISLPLSRSVAPWEGPWSILGETMWSLTSPRAKRISGL